jgi:hypothetical protein
MKYIPCLFHLPEWRHTRCNEIITVDGRFNGKIGCDEIVSRHEFKHRRKAEAKDVCDTPNERLKELWSRR